MATIAPRYSRLGGACFLVTSLSLLCLQWPAIDGVYPLDACHGLGTHRPDTTRWRRQTVCYRWRSLLMERTSGRGWRLGIGGLAASSTDRRPPGAWCNRQLGQPATTKHSTE